MLTSVRSSEQISERLNGLIEEIHGFQRANMHGKNPSDVILVAHGHLLRALTKRWLCQPLDYPISMIFEPGAICVLR